MLQFTFIVTTIILVLLAPASYSLPVDDKTSRTSIVNLQTKNRTTRPVAKFSVSSRKSLNSTKSIPVVARASCESDGLGFADTLGSFQCKTFNDLIGLGTSTATSGLESLANVAINDPQIASIQEYVIKPIINGLTQRIDSLSSISPSSPAASILESNMCLGNFKSFDVFDDVEGVCGTLPIDGEWTILGFSLDVGIGSPFHSLCPTITDPLGTYASVCIGLTLDSCSKLPSVGLAMSTNIFSCTPFDQILSASTAGASVAVIKAVDVAFDSFTFGVSLSNAFRKEVKLYNGNQVIPDFVAPGAIYGGGELAISPKSFSLPEVFELSGEAAQMFGFNADVSKVQSIVTGLTTSSKSGAAGVLDLVGGVQFSVLNTLVLNLQFVFSNLKNSTSKAKSIASALPDSDPFEVGTATLFATSYDVEYGDNNDKLSPGLYLYASASPGNIIKALVKYFLTFTGSIIDAIPDWLPVDLNLDPSELANKIDTSGSSSADFTFAIAATIPDRIVLYIQVPLVITQLGYLRLRCEIDVSGAKFKCTFSTKFNVKFFGAIANAVKDGVLWVAKKLDSIGDDIASAGKEVLAVGMSTLGDAAQNVGSAFSTATITATADAIEAGEIALSTLGDAAGEVASWAAAATGKFEGLMNDVGSAVENGVKQIGKTGKEAIGNAKDAFDSAQHDLEKSVNTFASVMGCSTSAVVSALKNKNTNCWRANNVRNTLNAVGRNVENAISNVENTFSNVANKIANAFADALKGVFGIGNQRRKKVRVESTRLANVRHSSGCELTEYTKVTEWEKRTCVIFCGSWKHDRTDREILGRKPQEDCVNDVVTKMQDAMGKTDKVYPLETKYNDLAKSDSACTTAKSIAETTLQENGLMCKTTFDHRSGEKHRVLTLTGFKSECKNLPLVGRICQNVPAYSYKWTYQVPVAISCSVPQINSNGAVQNKKLTVKRSAWISVLQNGVDETAIKNLKKDAVDGIISFVSINCKAK